MLKWRGVASTPRSPGHGRLSLDQDEGSRGVTLGLGGDDKTARERLREVLRIYASFNTRLAYATDLGIPLEWVPGYTPPDPSRRRGRRRATPTGLAWLNW